VPEVKPDLVIGPAQRRRSGRVYPVSVTAPGFLPPAAASRGVTVLVCQLIGAREDGS